MVFRETYEEQMVAPYVIEFCRFSLVITFASAVVGKLFAVDDVAWTVFALGVGSDVLARAVVGVVIGSESIDVVLFAIGYWRPAVGTVALACATGLLAVFTGALVLALLRRVHVSCNCFGRHSQDISWYDVTRNVMLGLVAAAGLVCSARYGRASPLAISSRTTVDLMAATVVVLTVHVRDVVELLRLPFLWGRE